MAMSRAAAWSWPPDVLWWPAQTCGDLVTQEGLRSTVESAHDIAAGGCAGAPAAPKHAAVACMHHRMHASRLHIQLPEQVHVHVHSCCIPRSRRRTGTSDRRLAFDSECAHYVHPTVATWQTCVCCRRRELHKQITESSPSTPPLSLLEARGGVPARTDSKKPGGRSAAGPTSTCGFTREHRVKPQGTI